MKAKTNKVFSLRDIHFFTDCLGDPSHRTLMVASLELDHL